MRLRKSQLGYKFRRQHAFGKYIIDFYCPSLLLAIEVDGSIHGEVAQKTRDEIRQRFLEDNFIQVVRVTNEQVIFDMESVVIYIKFFCDNLKRGIHPL